MSWETLYSDSQVLAGDDHFSIVTEDIENSAAPTIGEEMRGGRLRVTIEALTGGLSGVALYEYGSFVRFLTAWESVEVFGRDWDLILIDSGDGDTYNYTVERWVEEELIFCEFTPPVAVVRLEEQMVACQQLPRIEIGMLIEMAARHLAGQERSNSIVYAVWENTQRPVSVQFPVKPGARDIKIAVLMFVTNDDGDDGQATVTGTFTLGAHVQELEIDVPVMTNAELISEASWYYFVFNQIGDYPGELQNAGTATFEAVVSGVGNTICPFTVSQFQLFTSKITQKVSR